MRNSSFFEKLTGSLKLSEEDLDSLNSGSSHPTSASTKTKNGHRLETETVLFEDEADFEIPNDAEIETIEEVIEDENIDHEEIEEYYEEIIEDDDTVEQEATFPIFHVANLPERTRGADTVLQEESHADHTPVQIDVFEMHHEIVLRVLVPGITPENLKVSITRNHVSLHCVRPAPEGIPEQNYFEREIPYGEFERTIHLPSDVDVEHAEAVEKYGLLIIRLPKLDAKKVQELKIKSA